MPLPNPRLGALPLLCALAQPGAAQFNDVWIAFEPAPAALSASAPLSDDEHEVDLDWADLDLDGDTDVVFVRKQPFTTEGKRTNVLLLNEGGVLTDRSASLASQSDLPGDMGFLTPTNDRDVVLADLTGDGFPEVTTAVDMSDSEPKAISHPRVYLNLGGASWGGLRHEDVRIPELLHAQSGLPFPPRFPAVDAGDVDLDGDVDLYFGDHNTSLTFFGQIQPPAEDLDDRLLLNDGAGFFTDGSALSLSSDMLFSNFCNSLELVDLNGDGTLEVLKQATYDFPDSAYIAYNDPTQPGQFVFYDTFFSQTPYYVSSGDLNQDGRPDVVLSQNDLDVWIVNEATLPNGRVQWAPAQPYEYLVPYEFGMSFAGNNLVADLDADGWSEVLFADVDPELAQYQEDKRARIFHNRGGTVGGSDLVLREERASNSADDWLGVHGPTHDDLRWTHDIGVLDVDGDGLLDLLLARREGTQLWRQVPPPVCQEDLGFGALGGSLVLEVCGEPLASGQTAELLLRAAPPLAPLFLGVGAAANPLPLPGFELTLVPLPLVVVVPASTDAEGRYALSLPGGGGPAEFVLQAVVADTSPGGFSASNALRLEYLP